MNIAHIVPYSVTFPLTKHNGRYDWVLQLARLQAKAGHAVTIYCNPGSVLPDLETKGIAQSYNDKTQNNIATFRLAFGNNHDIYHSHFDNLHYDIGHETDRPIIFTQHWWPSDDTIKKAGAYKAKNICAVPPTRFMYDFDASVGIPTHGHIYHGIDLDFFKPQAVEPSRRLLCVGRITPQKHIEIAIATAKQSGLGLDIIGKMSPKDSDYWNTLLPDIDGMQIQYLGPKTQTELLAYYTAATAVVFASDVSETFGLVAIESQACGTPIIMQKGGSRGELLQQGRTGFLCSSLPEFVDAARAAASLQAADCIEFASNFGIQTMAAAYEKLYVQMLY